MATRYIMFLVLCVMISVVTGYAEDFTADMVSISSQGPVTAKLYVSGNKSRMEMPGATTISRIDNNVVWVLMPLQKMYMEQPLDPRTAASTQEKMGGEISRTAEGTETINGMITMKYRVTYETQGKRQSLFQWLGKTIQIPVKTAAIDGSWSTEFKNIKIGPQNQELFEIPSGYQKMALGISNMGGIMKVMDQKRE